MHELHDQTPTGWVLAGWVTRCRALHACRTLAYPLRLGLRALAAFATQVSFFRLQRLCKRQGGRVLFDWHRWVAVGRLAFFLPVVSRVGSSSVLGPDSLEWVGETAACCVFFPSLRPSVDHA